MLIVLSVAAAAALVVVAYSKLREHSPDAGTAGLRAVRDLADVVIVCVKAVEGVVDVLSRSPQAPLNASTSWGGYSAGYPYAPDFGDEPL
ncbi:hypothetical protein OO014_04235 [Intrasporangium calvum]|uniref:Secreted protein n=1 Tax=Intrasporangium calvum TaxID=53358 RepID=A0ABT5GDX0_9MICO|nr:hypothetical protein [Intrasporangium calvum]MDC5696455.1 hypothetical protein [Intrasporangium calvum]